MSITSIMSIKEEISVCLIKMVFLISKNLTTWLVGPEITHTTYPGRETLNKRMNHAVGLWILLMQQHSAAMSTLCTGDQNRLSITTTVPMKDEIETSPGDATRKSPTWKIYQKARQITSILVYRSCVLCAFVSLQLQSDGCVKDTHAVEVNFTISVCARIYMYTAFATHKHVYTQNKQGLHVHVCNK